MMFIKSVILSLAMVSALPLDLGADRSATGLNQASLGDLEGSSTSISGFDEGISATDQESILDTHKKTVDLMTQPTLADGKVFEKRSNKATKGVEARGHYIIIIHPGEPLPTVWIVVSVLGGIILVGSILSFIFLCVSDCKYGSKTRNSTKARRERTARASKIFMMLSPKSQEEDKSDSDVESQLGTTISADAQQARTNTKQGLEAQGIVTPPVECYVNPKNQFAGGKPIASLHETTSGL